MEQEGKLVGYAVKLLNSPWYVIPADKVRFTYVKERPRPVQLKEAYRIAYKYMAYHGDGTPMVEPIFKKYTTLELTSMELVSVIRALCSRNGLHLVASEDLMVSSLEAVLRSFTRSSNPPRE